MKKNLPETYKYLAEIPKAELHVHLEGTIAPELLFHLANRNKLSLPYSHPEDVLNLQIKQKNIGQENLSNFLECLDISRGVLKQPEDYYDIAMGYFKQCQEDNIVYVEIMFDPQQGIRQGIDFEAIMDSLIQARSDGKEKLNIEAQWIMCFQRDYSPNDAMTVLLQAEPYQEHIVGIGLDNYETPGFPDLFTKVFQEAKKRGYCLTTHCDVNQAESLTNIFQSIDKLNVSRIDHGLNSAQDEELIKIIKSKRVGLTGCPTFYVNETEAPSDRMKMIQKLLKAGVLISLNTDDPAQFGSGWLLDTLVAAQKSGGFSRAEMVLFQINAFRSAWLDDDRKKHYLEVLETFCKTQNIVFSNI